MRELNEEDAKVPIFTKNLPWTRPSWLQAGPSYTFQVTESQVILFFSFTLFFYL